MEIEERRQTGSVSLPASSSSSSVCFRFDIPRVALISVCYRDARTESEHPDRLSPGMPNSDRYSSVTVSHRLRFKRLSIADDIAATCSEVTECAHHIYLNRLSCPRRPPRSSIIPIHAGSITKVADSHQTLTTLSTAMLYSEFFGEYPSSFTDLNSRWWGLGRVLRTGLFCLR